jgi:hypothetical protein
MTMINDPEYLVLSHFNLSNGNREGSILAEYCVAFAFERALCVTYDFETQAQPYRFVRKYIGKFYGRKALEIVGRIR